MRLVVFGGRDYSERAVLFDRLDALHAQEAIEVVIEGEASGADKLGRAWAEARGVPVLPFPAEWDDIHRPGAVVRKTARGKPYDAAAGGVRNQRMIDAGRPTRAIAFPGGKGTRDMMERCLRAGITLDIV